MSTGDEQNGIAIIGLAGRFPGAPDVATFWKNICNGVESLSKLDEADLRDAFEPATRAAPNFVRARGLLEDADRFDHEFFNVHAREAELTDPQHRILLETAWEALEDAGCDPATYAGRVGVYAGCSVATYLLKHVLGDRSAIEAFSSEYQVGSFPELLGNGHDFLATRIAYKLNLRGPAMTVQAACSTALLAVAQACQTLAQRAADVMLAGAASITFPQERGYLHGDGGMVSSDGTCRPFDADASGTVFGAGAGMVVLKRLAEARADGDTIYAVIRGIGINNDGSGKVGYSAPSVAGQAAAVAAAQRMAGFAPETIDYVECHGTGTPLGDPVEIAALAKVFSVPGARGGARCAIGSVKPNVGHLDVAAGMAGLIKTALAIRYGKIPPTLHYAKPNPRIDFASTPFFVNTALCDWPSTASPRRAGVSAFGVGGTNVHLVLEAEPEPVRASRDVRPQLLVLSARSDAALGRARSRMSAFLEANPHVPLADVAATLQTGRRAFSHRFALASSSTGDAARKLRANADGPAGIAGATNVAFLFPGQGAQYAGMGRSLYASHRVFREAVDRCAEIVAPRLGRDIRELMFAADGDDASVWARSATSVAQPAIFTVDYALAQLWLSWGIRPVATVGHSVGEFVSATLAGVFSLEDALSVVTERGRLMQALPHGAMLAVRLGEADLLPLLPPSLGIAARNAPLSCVVAGPLADIVALETELERRETMYKRVLTSHAFHSPMMDALREPLARAMSRITLSEPSQPYVSTVTGRWIEPGEATSPAYWANHARVTVRFADAVKTLLEAGVTAFVEVGPGTALAAAARQGAGRTAGCTIVSSLSRDNDEDASLLEALGSLWVAGAQPAWQAIENIDGARRVPLPAYPFERHRHWIDAPAAPVAAVAATGRPPLANDDVSEVALARLLEELSGERIEPAHAKTSFLELGFDSLFLGRFAQQIKTRFGVDVTFRQLLNQLPTLAALSAHVAAAAPPKKALVADAAPAPETVSPYEAVVREQLRAMQELMREQLRVFDSASSCAPAPVPAAPTAGARGDATRFDAFKIALPPVSGELTDAQRAHIAALVARVNARTPGSKASTQRYRPVLADPRVAAGFRSEWKEMVYPIVCARAAGSRLWDIDGNEYIDILNGFGQTAFGHGAPFVVEAVRERLELGFAIGPQTDLAGEVAERFCALTGNERMTFCNTGSEAVMAALRIARTVTGRDRVVVFAGSYHGQFDEVLVKGTRTMERSIPIAPGIPASAVSNVTVLPYGAPESVTWIREHAHELAAVVVEPVQSRHPALTPQTFLHEIRTITRDAGTALVFDEVVTGFRMHPGGMQFVFGIRADLATYGKVVGGGLPIGILAGSARFMDALDGGMWHYGDDSVPEVSPTFFAGTFVRHPLVMAAVLAVLRRLEAQGPALQEALTARTAALVGRLNLALERRGLPGAIESYGSMFHFNFSAIEPLAGLLYYHLRDRGVYIQEGFPCFLTTAHTQADIDAIARAFEASLDELQSAGIFGAAPVLDSGVLLTEAQKEIYLAAQFGDAASCAYNESVTVRVSGALDLAAAAKALDDVVARHESLRGSFGATGESMSIANHLHVEIAVVDVRCEEARERDAAVASYVERDARTAFDLVAGPLVRCAILRLADDDHALILTVHHIVCDGWSINVILDEFAESYRARINGTPAVLATPLAFSAYATRMAARDPAEIARVEQFWHAQFAEPVPALDLPTDRPRAAIKAYNGGTRCAHIDRNDYLAIKAAGAQRGCTLFVTLLAAFAGLMGRLAACRDVVVGIPAAGQALLDDEILVGHCVDFLAVRNRWTPQTRLADLLGSVRAAVLDAYDHQSYTLGTLVRTLAPQRVANRLPLAEIQFNLERLAGRFDLAGISAHVVPNAKAHVNFDLFLNVIESEDGLRIDCDYNADLFDATTIDRWLSDYRTTLATIVADASTRVDDVRPEPPASVVPVAPGIASGAESPSREKTLTELFETRVCERPAAIAAMCGDERITYADLDRRANRVAHHLLERTGGPGKLVGVVLDRSLDMLVALLATLKADCAYVPLDPKHPIARQCEILAITGAAAVFAEPSIAAAIAPAFPVICFDADRAAIAAASPESPVVERNASHLAYVIFTSGSTGTPKGVEIEHASLSNLLQSMAVRPGLGENDRLLAVTTMSFDIAALELFLPLVTGATTVIATSEEVADGHRLLARLQSARITAMQATPALWRVLIEAGFRAGSGFLMLCGGEPLRHDVASRLLEGEGELWNMYGPTETTIWSTCGRVALGGTIDAGTPIANTQCYVLDEHDEPVPAGTIGQLHIAGAGLARGYTSAPDATAQAFVSNPFGAGRMYRTGDTARILANGAIEILGRLDHQVKIRGHRVEIGEIEARLSECADLAASAVALREDHPGLQRLVGYFVERLDRATTPAALSAYLATRLPDYMIPATWMRVSELPLTSNGKLDRNALPAPPSAPAHDDAYEAPQGPLQTALASICCEVLRIDRVGANDDLFTLGADSIGVFAITARANRQGIKLLAKHLFTHRTVARVAGFLEAQIAEAARAAVPSLSLVRRQPDRDLESGS